MLHGCVPVSLARAIGALRRLQSTSGAVSRMPSPPPTHPISVSPCSAVHSSWRLALYSVRCSPHECRTQCEAFFFVAGERDAQRVPRASQTRRALPGSARPAASHLSKFLLAPSVDAGTSPSPARTLALRRPLRADARPARRHHSARARARQRDKGIRHQTPATDFLEWPAPTRCSRAGF